VTLVDILISYAVPPPPVGAGLAPPGARISRSKLCPTQPMFVGARHAVPFFRFAPTPTVNLSSLYAMLTKNKGVLPNARRSSASFVGAQFIASPSHMLPTLPCPTSASHARSEPAFHSEPNPFIRNAYKNNGGAR